MKTATLMMWLFIFLAVTALAKSAIVIRQVDDYEHQHIASLMMVASSFLAICAVGCANLRAIRMRADGQSARENRGVINGS